MKINHRTKRVILSGISGFIGAGLGSVAGSSETWINMLVGAFGAVLIVVLLNGFIKE